METSKRLNDIMSEIKLIYLECQEKNKVSLQKKYENYNKSVLLINEAKQLIDSLQKEITSLDTSKADKSQVCNANKLIDLLSVPNLNFAELLDITKELKNICAGLPNMAQVINNVAEEIMYEETDP